MNYKYITVTSAINILFKRFLIINTLQKIIIITTTTKKEKGNKVV